MSSRCHLYVYSVPEKQSEHHGTGNLRHAVMRNIPVLVKTGVRDRKVRLLPRLPLNGPYPLIQPKHKKSWLPGSQVRHTTTAWSCRTSHMPGHVPSETMQCMAGLVTGICIRSRSWSDDFSFTRLHFFFISILYMLQKYCLLPVFPFCS